MNNLHLLATAAALVALGTAAQQGADSPPVQHVTVNGVDLAFVAQGKGETVLFVHGATGDWRTWEDLRPSMAVRYRYVSMSRRYHYPNAWADNGERYTRAQHVEDVAAFIRALGGARVHLVGNSYGGTVAARVALKYPELLRSVVLGEPIGLLAPRSDEARAAVAALTADLSKASDAAATGDHQRAVKLFYDGVVEEPGAFDRLPRRAQDQRLANARTVEPTRRPDPSMPLLSCDDIAALKVPALAVRGERTRAAFRHVVEELLTCLPKTTETAIIPGAHHAWNAANPKDSARAILAFVAKR